VTEYFPQVSSRCPREFVKRSDWLNWERETYTWKLQRNNKISVPCITHNKKNSYEYEARMA